jgi:hypothetical protein
VVIVVVGYVVRIAARGLSRHIPIPITDAISTFMSLFYVLD